MVLGHGGVGKTSSAAALAIAWARMGKRTLVMTIDPAKRLADAMGLAPLDNEVRAVPVDGTSGLYGMMLDTKATWDETVRRHCEDPDRAQALLSNRYYRALSTRLTGSHEYMATERLYQLASREEFEVIVVDTPPARHALEFLKAPSRIHRLLSRSLLQKLSSPTGLSHIASIGLRKTRGGLRGKTVLADISEFFRLIGGVSVGLRQHAEQVEQWLSGPSTRFIWVTTAQSQTTPATQSGIQQLAAAGYPLSHLFINRLSAHSGTAAPSLAKPDGLDSDRWKVILAQLNEAWTIERRRAQEQERVLEHLASCTTAPLTRLTYMQPTNNPMEIVLGLTDQLGDLTTAPTD